MVTYFNKKDLVKFGRYLLSEERSRRISDMYNPNDNVSLEDRLREVYDSDIDNFKESL